MKRREILFRKFASGLLAFALMAGVLPANGFSAEMWESYSEYIPQSTPVQKRHLRGAWVSSVINLDWPTKQTSLIANSEERIAKSKQELVAIMDRAEDMNMNALYFQVSPEGDALYSSDIVPWSRYLTGTFGKDPGFDPLQFAVEEAHKRNIELHAWLNPYRVAMSTDDSMRATLNVEKSVYKDHPDWIRAASNRLIVDPGIPEAKDWVVSRVMEVVQKYDVDGIHFDDYFYLSGVDDQSTFEKYNAGEFSNIGDWRRNNTYELVKEISEAIESEKPWVKFGISPSGVWANKKDGYPDGSNTSASLTHYDKSYADTKKWISEEIIDYIAPQVYWSFENKAAPYGELGTWWSEVVKGKDVHLYMGQALYKANDDTDPAFQGVKAVDEFERQLKFNAMKPEISGSIMFRFRNVYDAGKQDVVKAIENDFWAKKALVPVMEWKGGKAPKSPESGNVELSGEGLKLSFSDKDASTAYYAVYRVDKGVGLDVNTDQSANYLVGTVRKSGQTASFTDRGNYDKDTVYAVTSLDRLHNESGPRVVGANNSKYFYDVGAGSGWAIAAVDGLYEREVVKGIGNGLFAPGSSVRRADFLIMVMNSYGIEVEENLTDNFSDAGSTYYTGYLATAKKHGIVQGVGDGKFNPEGSISRQDMFVILHRALESIEKLPTAGEPVRKLEDYADRGEIDDYALEAMKLFVETGVVQGDGGYLKPLNSSSRAEASQVMYNLISDM